MYYKRMGSSCSANIEVEDIEVKAPFCECILKHCTSSCLKKAPKEDIQPAPQATEKQLPEDKHETNAQNTDAVNEIKK